MKISRTCFAAVAALALCNSRAEAADEGGITVSGAGEVKAKPTRVEIDLQTAGSAELTGDAIVKFRDTKRRTLEAFNKLKLKNLSIEEQGLSLANAGGGNPQQMAMMVASGQAPAAKPQVEISRTIRVVLKDIQETPEEELMETISKILDTAKDSGAVVNPNQSRALMAQMFGQQLSNSLVTFVLDNAEELREQAYKQAMAAAQDRAGRLAALAAVKLGPVLSVQESALAATNESSPLQMYMAMFGMRDTAGKEDSRVTSDKYADIPVRVSLQVRFGIEKK
jgi:uncharacterized protein YggE